MMRPLMALFLLVLLAAPIATTAQDAGTAPQIDRSATGGAQTLEDILARQRGERIDNSFRSENIGGDAVGVPELGPMGGASDADLWRALRYNKADVTASTRDDRGRVLIQDGGMSWLTFRRGPLATYGGWLLLGTIALLAVFFVLRGRIRIEGEKTGRTVTRFQWVERFAHWLLAGSFLLLAFTGLFMLFGRSFIAPYLGLGFNAKLLGLSKLTHTSVGWAFILGLVMIFVMWVWHNLPDRTDLKWFAQAGGIIGNKHPPAKKFNGGQKIIFWSVVILGGSIAVSGVSLLFPYELPLFAKTFGVLNDIGVPGWVGQPPFPTALAPQEEMQFAQMWHAIVGFVLMAIIIAHIYIGSIGMEGAFDAMGSGEVDEAWAHQHHSIWYARVKEEEAGSGATKPAE